MMSINTIGADEIARRKTVSDEKNNTDELTFAGNSFNARADAYRRSRDLLDAKEIKDLEDGDLYDYA